MKSLKENFKKAHIVIIGSGIIGKFNALELSELGFQITLIDPTTQKNSSNAALGLLMGNMYQKRKGRSWSLRKQSIELWPKWIELLREFNQELNIEKPLIQLTTNEEKFKKLEKFINENNDINLRILENNKGKKLVAVDPVGAREGNWVFTASGSAARFACPNPEVQTDLTIGGIIDFWESD